MAGQTYNPYDNVLKVMDDAAALLGYSSSDIEALAGASGLQTAGLTPLRTAWAERIRS